MNLNDQDIDDMIRIGWKSEDMSVFKNQVLRMKITNEENINKAIKRMKDYETGKIKVTCTEKDKKRIIKEKLKGFMDYEGMTKDEAKKEIEHQLENFHIEWIK